MNTYEIMKDSRTKWLGYIPSTWGTRLLKYAFSIQKDIAGETGHTVLSVTQHGIVRSEEHTSDSSHPLSSRMPSSA